MYRIISGEKIKKLRGGRSLEQVAEAAGNVFTRVALHQWEKGGQKPRDRNLTALMAALNCQWEDISEPYEDKNVR